MYNELAEITAILSLVSIATERVVEIVKPALPDYNPKYRTSVYSLIACSVSLVILGINNLPMPDMFPNVIVQHVVLALACTAGSGFWNDALKVLQSLKVKTPT